MDTSFYYFFSSTPQVLGAIMALFGVFVIFKIQSLVEVMLIIAKDIALFIDKSYEGYEKSIKKILDAIDERNIKDLNITITSLSDGLFSPVLTYELRPDDFVAYGNYKKRFATLHTIYNDLIKNTITTTFLTAIIIVVCLILLPFVRFLTEFPCLLFSIFGIITICIGIVLWKLIYILKRSIK
jgi:hypothetical protein